MLQQSAQKGIPEGKVFELNKQRLAAVGATALQEMLNKRDWSALPVYSAFAMRQAGRSGPDSRVKVDDDILAYIGVEERREIERDNTEEEEVEREVEKGEVKEIQMESRLEESWSYETEVEVEVKVVEDVFEEEGEVVFEEVDEETMMYEMIDEVRDEVEDEVLNDVEDEVVTFQYYDESEGVQYMGIQGNQYEERNIEQGSEYQEQSSEYQEQSSVYQEEGREYQEQSSAITYSSTD